MKLYKIFVFTLFITLASNLAKAQFVYNNEWINYNKTYYKFKIASTGMYRITGAQLQTLGLGSTPAEQFQIYNNGSQVPISQSILSGVLSNVDYLEFYATGNDGKLDTKMYRDPTKHLNNKFSLQTDTAAYYLTVETNATLNKRFTKAINNVAANTLPAEPFFMHNIEKYYRTKISDGYAQVVGEYIYSSSYDVAEGWTSRNINPSTPMQETFSGLNFYAPGPVSTLKYGLSGEALGNRVVRVSVNNVAISSTNVSFFSDLQQTLPIHDSLLTANNFNVSFNNLSPNAPDVVLLAGFTLNYASTFNFNNSKLFTFSLPASSTGNYLEISNFNAGTVLPILLDTTNKISYTAVLINGKYAFALDPSAVTRGCIMVNAETSNTATVNAFKTTNFINYNTAATQGDYIIISNKFLINATPNRVEDYKQYRASAAGGAFNAKIYDAEQLEDQFAFGVKKHPLSVKNFLKYAMDKYPVMPKNILLIGKGMDYRDYRANEANPLTERLNLIPTFGYPASDNFLASANAINSVPLVPIGRLSVVTNNELKDYLDKVKEYDLVTSGTIHTIEKKLWQKNIVQVSGSSDVFLDNLLRSYLTKYDKILSDTSWGASVKNFIKSTNTAVETLTSVDLENEFKNGIGLLSYFGHSSATTLQYNLDNPQNYINPGKYPIFVVNGCNSGNYFTFYADRFTTNETLSEKYVLAPNRGAIAFIASTHFGIVNYLDILSSSLYDATNNTNYNGTIGQAFQKALATTYSFAASGDFYARIHTEESGLHGDPALKLTQQEKPDYCIEQQTVKINPAFISISENTFNVEVVTYNLGKAVKDSINISVKRIYPNGTSEIVYNKKYRGTYYSDTFMFSLPILPLRDVGLNKLEIKVESGDLIAEMSETNNILTKEFYIFEDDIKPIFPYNYAIVNTAPITLNASTANVLAALRTYRMELDTTALFNSSFKITQLITTKGGLLEFKPTFTPIAGRAYYWRVATIPNIAGEPFKWNEFSFTFLPTSSEGFNFGHLYQFTKGNFDKLKVDSTTRIWEFKKVVRTMFMSNAVYPSAGFDGLPYTSVLNSNEQIEGGCNYHTLMFTLINSNTGKILENVTIPNPLGGTMGLFGGLAVCGPRKYNHEFLINTKANRDKALNFMRNLIPDGYYVMVRNVPHPTNLAANIYAADMQADESINGTGNSIYAVLKNAGFSIIDDYNSPKAWNFLYKKGDPSFPSAQVMAPNITAKAVLNVNLLVFDGIGSITTPAFGPAKQWNELRYNITSIEAISTDNTKIELIGINSLNNEVVLGTYTPNTLVQNISSINATQYPYLKVRLTNVDTINSTPGQLDFIRLNYIPVPEGAMAPNIAVNLPDTLDVGQPANIAVAFKNVSKIAFDSIALKLVIVDKNNVRTEQNLPKLKALQPNDTAMIRYNFATENFAGVNNFYLEANPDNNQPEQFHFNNFFYKNIYVKPDSTNPFLDVTYDGVHIINRDIISANPNILVKLKDENRFLALGDTSLLKVRFGLVGGTMRTIPFDGTIMRFIPANLSSGQNTATIEFNPLLEDGEYELLVTGKDKAGNKAGDIEYRGVFRVINKPMVSNLLNYPNPFTTSTAFVFTLTGKQVPQEFKIEILTVSGKIVRTITKDEIGSLNIGRNLTTYKWDGTDQYGAPLANGVYLYHLITSVNGEKLEKFRLNGRESDQNRLDVTDQYFKGGYGKMVLLR